MAGKVREKTKRAQRETLRQNLVLVIKRESRSRQAETGPHFTTRWEKCNLSPRARFLHRVRGISWGALVNHATYTMTIERKKKKKGLIKRDTVFPHIPEKKSKRKKKRKAEGNGITKSTQEGGECTAHSGKCQEIFRCAKEAKDKKHTLEGLK